MIPLKSPREIAKMRESGAVTTAIMDELLRTVQEGVTTGDLDALAEKLMREMGAVSASGATVVIRLTFAPPSMRRWCMAFRGPES